MRYTVISLAGLCLISTLFYALWIPKSEAYILFLLFAALFTVASVLFSLFRIKNKITAVGGMVTHTGFAIFVIGIILAFANTKVLTKQAKGANGTHAARSDQSIMLKRGLPVRLGRLLYCL